MSLKTLIKHPLETFFDRKIHPSDIKPSEEEKQTVSITFRLPAEMKNYYQQMADASRTSLQGAVLKVLDSVKDKHIIDQPAEDYACLISDRFFQIFEAAGVPIRRIPEFLKDFDVTRQDLTSNTRVVQLISNDLLVDFLAGSFLLNPSWIVGEEGVSHKESVFNKDLESFLSLAQEASKDLSLKVLIDDHILSDNSINDKTREARYVHLALVEKSGFNDISFNRVHLFTRVNWDRKREHNTLAVILNSFQLLGDQNQGETKTKAKTKTEIE
jgi:hypothetical protein